jgi:hypothetical protein
MRRIVCTFVASLGFLTALAGAVMAASASATVYCTSPGSSPTCDWRDPGSLYANSPNVSMLNGGNGNFSASQNTGGVRAFYGWIMATDGGGWSNDGEQDVGGNGVSHYIYPGAPVGDGLHAEDLSGNDNKEYDVMLYYPVT